jgi:hypothetical protein
MKPTVRSCEASSSPPASSLKGCFKFSGVVGDFTSFMRISSGHSADKFLRRFKKQFNPITYSK